MTDNKAEAYRRSADALGSRDEKVVRVSLDGWSTVTGVELVQFRDQAAKEAATYTERDRPTLARTFAGLSSMANAELEGRVVDGDAPALWLSITAPLDETSGAEANKDDLGVLIVRALALYSDPDTRGGTRNIWGRVIAAIMSDRERLRMLGLSL